MGQHKKLYKSRQDKMIDGVCGGVAEYLNTDASIVRIIWGVTVLWGGFGLLAYLVAMIIVPSNPEQEVTDAKTKHAGAIWGILLVIFGLSLLFNELNFHWFFRNPFHLFHWPIHYWSGYWPLLLVAIGVAYLIIIVHGQRSNSSEDTPATKKKKNDDDKEHGSITRDTSNKWIAGVCSGFAAYFNMDINLLRLLVVLAALISNLFFFIIVYIVLWIVLPEN